MRDSQSILDQMIAFCADSITESDVLDVYGLVSGDDIDALARRGWSGRTTAGCGSD